MQIFKTSEITGWPDDVILGYSTISEEGNTAILSAAEEKEYWSFSNEQRRQEYLSSRHLFRFVLEAAGLDPGKVKLGKESSGKPYASNGNENVHVSFSHSKDLVMCAVSLNRDIGLDIEHTARVVNRKVVKRILNDEEWEVVGEEDPLKLWTIKEAGVKRLGTGLRTNLKDLTIRRNKEKGYSVIFNDDNSFEICSFRQLNHQIALAY